MRKLELTKMYLGQDIKDAAINVLESGYFVGGENLRKFEKEFAEFCDVKYGVGVNSGTAAIFLSLMALGIGRGDEVIVPSHTFIATVSPLLFFGAKPVFVDINKDTYELNPDLIKEKITDKTKAIIPVHIYGHPCDMDPLNDVAKEFGLHVVEDACQAHGAEYKKKKTGSLGDLACFSFYPSKNMTVCGDGGMVVTNNKELAEKIMMLRDHGRKEKYLHEILGLNLRMSEIPAAIGREQLKHLPDWLEKRRAVAKLYGELLDGINQITLPIEKEWAKHVYHLYVIRNLTRDKLRNWLTENSIPTGIHYPIPVHKQPVLDDFTKDVNLPVTESYADEILSLPMHPFLSNKDVEYIVENIKEFFK